MEVGLLLTVQEWSNMSRCSGNGPWKACEKRKIADRNTNDISNKLQFIYNIYRYSLLRSSGKYMDMHLRRLGLVHAIRNMEELND